MKNISPFVTFNKQELERILHQLAPSEDIQVTDAGIEHRHGFQYKLILPVTSTSEKIQYIADVFKAGLIDINNELKSDLNDS